MNYPDARSKIPRSSLTGKKVQAVVHTEHEITLIFDDGLQYTQEHLQDCCETVTVYDVNPPLDTIVGGVLHSITVEYGEGPHARPPCTWTFYKIHTSKGSVDIRWYGESNGYYSEEVDETYRDGNVYGRIG